MPRHHQSVRGGWIQDSVRGGLISWKLVWEFCQTKSNIVTHSVGRVVVVMQMSLRLLHCVETTHLPCVTGKSAARAFPRQKRNNRKRDNSEHVSGCYHHCQPCSHNLEISHTRQYRTNRPQQLGSRCFGEARGGICEGVTLGPCKDSVWGGGRAHHNPRKISGLGEKAHP